MSNFRTRKRGKGRQVGSRFPVKSGLQSYEAPEMEVQEVESFRPRYLYHGTNLSEDVVMKEGLRPQSKETYLDWIRQALESVGFDYDKWYKKRLVDQRQGRLNTLMNLEGEFLGGEIKAIWASDNPQTAWLYAKHRGSEIVGRAVREAYYDKHPYKGKKRTAERLSRRALRNIFGKSIVVVIDADKLRDKMEVHYGVNIPIKGEIPPEAIVGVKKKVPKGFYEDWRAKDLQ